MQHFLYSTSCSACDSVLSPRAKVCPQCDTEAPVNWTYRPKRGLAFIGIMFGPPSLLVALTFSAIAFAAVPLLGMGLLYHRYLKTHWNDEPKASWALSLVQGLAVFSVYKLSLDFYFEAGAKLNAIDSLVPFILATPFMFIGANDWVKAGRKKLSKYGVRFGALERFGCWYCGVRFPDARQVCSECGECAAEDGRKSFIEFLCFAFITSIILVSLPATIIHGTSMSIGIMVFVWLVGFGVKLTLLKRTPA